MQTKMITPIPMRIKVIIKAWFVLSPSSKSSKKSLEVDVLLSSMTCSSASEQSIPPEVAFDPSKQTQRWGEPVHFPRLGMQNDLHFTNV